MNMSKSALLNDSLHHCTVVALLINNLAASRGSMQSAAAAPQPNLEGQSSNFAIARIAQLMLQFCWSSHLLD